MAPSRITFVFVVSAAVACGENLTIVEHRVEGEAAGAIPCLPNLDGRIDADEMVPRLGVPVAWAVEDDVPIDLSGTDGPRGPEWDWSALPSDAEVARVAAEPLSGRWYADAFGDPPGAFVLPADDDLEAVHSFDERALWLHGLASRDPEPAVGRTQIVYTRPVAVLRFPIAPGARWTEVGDVQGGVIRGLPYAGTDTFTVSVAPTGVLHLPQLTFTEVHPVHTHLSSEATLGGSASQRQVSFLFECFGEIARATSRLDEPEASFTTAARLRRFVLEASGP